MSRLVAVAAAILAGFLVLRVYGAMAKLRGAFVAAFGDLEHHLKRRQELARALAEALGRQDLSHAARAAASGLRFAAADPLDAEGLAELSQSEAMLSRALAPFLEKEAGLEGEAALRARDLAAVERSAAVACHVVNERAATYDAARRRFPAVFVARLFAFGPAGRVGLSLPGGRDPRAPVAR